MKEFRGRIIFILLAIALAVYLLYPTFQDYQNTQYVEDVLAEKTDSIKAVQPEITESDLAVKLEEIEDSIRVNRIEFREARQKRVKLGLDLQGGMRVVLEVNTGELLEKLANNPDDKFREILSASISEANTTDESVVDILVRRLGEEGTRLSRYFGNIRQEDDEIIEEMRGQTADAVTRAEQIIRNRVDQYGVSEPSIQRQGSRRIIIELPGVSNEEEARQLLQGTALLEFKLLKEPEFAVNLMERIDAALAVTPASDDSTAEGEAVEGDAVDSETADGTEVAEADTSVDDILPEDQEADLEQFAKEHPFFAVALLDPNSPWADAYVKASDRQKLQRMLNRQEVQKIIPNNVEFLFSANSFTGQDGEEIYQLYLVNSNPELTGGVVTNALATLDPATSSPIVNMEMNSEGAAEWARITGANIGKRCAIVLDGVIFSAPRINSKISGGRSQIEGMADLEEAKLLEIVLKAGALPAPVDIIEERTVGPSLGQDSVSSGLNSILLGYGIVVIFMIFYYQRSGSIAALALTFTVLFILGVLAGFNATLTLPGMAGIVLTIGMAVDANVLIFERIREELNAGKTIKASVDGGFSKAYSAIWDSNITTFFTGIILYQFGTGPVQGFALTLMIGIASSLFAALVISRLIFDYMVAKGNKITVG